MIIVPLDVLNTIYKSLIQPVFDYCDVVWDNLGQGLATRIQKLQNRAAHIITFQGYDVCSAQIRKQLNWEELASRRQRHLSLLMYDTVNGNVPSYLSNLFSNVCENNLYKSLLEIRNIMSYWTTFQKQNIIKGLSHTEEECCGIHYQMT